jgi:hypothetical protein
MKKENMIFRLKLTDTLAKEMVAKLPESLFSSETKTFLDPSMGGGQYVTAIEARLRKAGHSDKNISKRVFGVEKSLLRVNYAVNKNKLVGSYSVDKKDVPSILMGMKFDVIVGNPPYQVLNEDGKNWGGGRKLWEEFVFRSTENLNDGGYLCYVHPVTWRAYSDKAILKHVHQKFNPIYINLETAKKYFVGVGSRFDWYVLQKSKYSGTTTVEAGVGQFSINIQDWPMLPSGFSATMASIITNLWNYTDKLEFGKNQSHHSDREHVSTEKSKKFKYPIQNTGAGETLWASEPHATQFKKKVLASRSGYLRPFYDNGTLGVSQDTFYMFVNSEKEAAYIIRLLNSNLMKFVLDATKTSGFFNHKLINTLPYPKGLSASFTDAELYAHFKLTNEEIKLIEDTIKD